MKLKKKILIVEDDSEIREGLRDLLVDEGYRIELAENGKVALEKLNGELPFVILLDLMMSVMDGFTFLAELEKTMPKVFKDVPVLVLTAAGDRANHVQGARQVIKKPIDVDALLAELEKL